jgi:hypothetical protein
MNKYNNVMWELQNKTICVVRKPALKIPLIERSDNSFLIDWNVEQINSSDTHVTIWSIEKLLLQGWVLDSPKKKNLTFSIHKSLIYIHPKGRRNSLTGNPILKKSPLASI